MEKTKIDRVIEVFRNYINLKEEMMVANAPGTQGGGGSQTDPTGKNGLVGVDPVIRFIKRKTSQIKLPPGSRKRWKMPSKE